MPFFALLLIRKCCPALIKLPKLQDPCCLPSCYHLAPCFSHLAEATFSFSLKGADWSGHTATSWMIQIGPFQDGSMRRNHLKFTLKKLLYLNFMFGASLVSLFHLFPAGFSLVVSAPFCLLCERKTTVFILWNPPPTPVPFWSVFSLFGNVCTGTTNVT